MAAKSKTVSGSPRGPQQSQARPSFSIRDALFVIWMWVYLHGKSLILNCILLEMVCSVISGLKFPRVHKPTRQMSFPDTQLRVVPAQCAS